MPVTILHLDSSPTADRSVSRKLTANIISTLQTKHTQATVITRDLAASAIPHLNGATIGAFFTPPEQRNDFLKEAIKLSDTLVGELQSADIIVIGVPMWNFGIPSVLKAWVDHIVRAGLTFKYGAAGVEGLLSPDKKVIIASSRGGVYSDGPMAAMDHQESYLIAILGFIGLKNIEVIRAEGVAMGEDGAQKAIDVANNQIAKVIS